MITLIAAVVTFIACAIGVNMAFGVLKMLGVYDIVEERRAHVYVLFGNVLGTIDQPGLHFLWARLGPAALIVRWLGTRHVVDLRIDQVYLRSQPVNSEEGAPMGIGIWYEMFVSDPIAFLFKNTDPRGSLAANVSNATVRCLSNMKLGEMLETRHQMSQMVRDEVSAKSNEWGYRLGSTYIRKVHFRDTMMIRQIEEKVTNRLRQVTSAIRQDGANQVSVIKSAAEREAAVEFAKAAALRPSIVGRALQTIGEDQVVAGAVFELLEIQKLIESGAKLTLLPAGNTQNAVLTPLLASRALKAG